VDGNGTAYARYPPLAVIGRNLKELPTVAAALARQGEGTAEAQGLDGEERLYGYAPIVLRAGGPPDGYVLIGIPRRTAFAEASLIAWRTLGGFAFVVLLGIAAVWYFGELFVLRSAGALAQAARRMAAGETDTVGELAREPGELGEYARTLEQLAAHRRLQHEDLVRTAAELQASERRYRDIIETAPDGILTVDENQTIVSFNASAEAMFGYTAREVVGQPWTSCCPSASAPHTMRMCARLPPSRCAAGAWAADASCRDGARMEPSFRWRSACRSSPRTARPCIPRWCAT
jgi:PAS domain S-box-containing protein